MRLSKSGYRNLYILLFFVIAHHAFTQGEQKRDTASNRDLKDYRALVKRGTLARGMFNILKVEDDYYFEISDTLLSRDFLLVNKLSQVPMQLNETGLNKGMNYASKLITFHRDSASNKVYVKTVKPMVSAPKSDAITKSVKDNFSESITAVFDITAINKEAGSILIKVNAVFDGRRKSFNDVLGSTSLGGVINPALSYIESAKAFPENIAVKSQLTTAVDEGGATLPLTVGVTSSIVLLPEKPMNPRFSDRRVGYFSREHWYFNDEQQAMKKRRLITRWRLEPKPGAVERYLSGERVEPQKPIVYYIDPAMPKKWRKYIMQGVCDWQSAFEQAGFKNAVIVKEPGSADSDFDRDDIRYSVITYAASPKANAMGPSVVDPRSGEIIQANIIWYHNVMTALHDWMRIQTGPIDPDSRQNTFADKHMGQAIRFVSAHEVGHTFGLKHNMGASFAFEVDSLRSETFTAARGTATSIMDYARFNYVAQPKDGVTHTGPKIGVYDKYAIQWGYRWYPDRKTEESALRTLVNSHSGDPLYFYGAEQDDKNVIDPRSQSEDLGNNAVSASTYGIENLKRVVNHILEWTYREGRSYYQAGKLYMGVIRQWQLYNHHVLNNIGGVYLNNAVYGDGKNSYTPVPYLVQKRATAYLNEQVFTIPNWLFFNGVLAKTYPIRDSPLGPYEQSPYTLVRDLQYEVFYDVLRDDRLLRLLEAVLYNPKGERRYTPRDLLDQIRGCIFKKTLKNKSLTLLERLTQKNYVDALIVSVDKLFEKTSKKKPAGASALRIPKMCNHSVFQSPALKNINYTSMKRTSEVTTLKRGELQTVLNLIQKKRNKGDQATRMHYLDLIIRIKQALND